MRRRKEERKRSIERTSKAELTHITATENKQFRLDDRIINRATTNQRIYFDFFFAFEKANEPAAIRKTAANGRKEERSEIDGTKNELLMREKEKKPKKRRTTDD